MIKNEKTNTVTRFSNDLAIAIKNTLTQYAELSQSLDRNFPKRLFSQTDSVSLTLDTINKRLKELEIRRERLRDTGLLGKEEDVNFEMPAVVDVDKQNVLYMFMEDVDQKLEHIP